MTLCAGECRAVDSGTRRRVRAALLLPKGTDRNAGMCLVDFRNKRPLAQWRAVGERSREFLALSCVDVRVSLLFSVDSGQCPDLIGQRLFISGLLARSIPEDSSVSRLSLPLEFDTTSCGC